MGVISTSTTSKSSAAMRPSSVRWSPSLRCERYWYECEVVNDRARRSAESDGLSSLMMTRRQIVSR